MIFGTFFALLNLLAVNPCFAAPVITADSGPVSIRTYEDGSTLQTETDKDGITIQTRRDEDGQVTRISYSNKKGLISSVQPDGNGHMRVRYASSSNPSDYPF